MKELLKLGVYTLLGTLLLSAPFAGLGMLSTHLVTEKTFWIQLITLFLSAVSLQGLWLNPSKELCGLDTGLYETAQNGTNETG